MKKRTETALVKAILQYLQCQENLGKIAWVDRLQSGRVTSTWNYKIRKTGESKKHTSRMNLCRPGTPDIMAILNYNGKRSRFVFIECKEGKNKQTKEQEDFQKMIYQCGHTYLVAKSLDDVLNLSLYE